MPPKKYDSEKILKEYVNGVTVHELNEKYGIPCDYVYELAGNAGIIRNKSFRAVHEKILALHDQGIHHKEIAKMVDFKAYRVFNLLKEKRNLQNIPKKILFEKNKDAIIDVFKSGCAIFAIAKKFDISRSYLSALLIKWFGKEEFKKIRNNRKILKKESLPKKEFKPRVKNLKKDLSFEQKFSIKLAEKVYFMNFGGMSYEKIASYFHITIEQVYCCVEVWKNHLKKSNN